MPMKTVRAREAFGSLRIRDIREGTHDRKKLQSKENSVLAAKKKLVLRRGRVVISTVAGSGAASLARATAAALCTATANRLRRLSTRHARSDDASARGADRRCRARV
eukprot:1969004-Pleurochrysis_carterae.AAC.1